MSLISICACLDCSNSSEPCKEYSSKNGQCVTTCTEERPSDDWCESCRDQLQDQFEALKAEEAKEQAEYDFEVRSAQGCV